MSKDDGSRLYLIFILYNLLLCLMGSAWVLSRAVRGVFVLLAYVSRRFAFADSWFCTSFIALLVGVTGNLPAGVRQPTQIGPSNAEQPVQRLPYAA